MTSTTYSSEIHAAPNAMMRLVNVMKLHLVNRFQLIVTPLLIVSFIFAVSLLIGWIFRSAGGPAIVGSSDTTIQMNGVLGFFSIYLLVLAVMAISQTFPFAQSYSVTRRDFYVGTVLTFFGFSVGYSLVITALGWVEDATHGWGLGVALFNPGFSTSNLAARFYATIALFLLSFMMGMATASVYVRWKANGMYIFFGLLTLLILGLVWLTTATNSWTAVGNWIVTTGLSGVATWSLLPSGLAIVIGFLILRKAIPRN